MDQVQAYRLFLKAMATPTSAGEYFARQLSYLYTTGPTRYDTNGSGAASSLRAKPVTNNRGVWANPTGSDAIGTLIPAGSDDTAFRSMTGYQHDNNNGQQLAPPLFVKQGVFDASKLPGYSGLAAVPLGTYANTTLTSAPPTPAATAISANSPPTSANNRALGHPRQAKIPSSAQRARTEAAAALVTNRPTRTSRKSVSDFLSTADRIAIAVPFFTQFSLRSS